MREPERDYGRLQDILQAANHILPELLWHTALVNVPVLKKQIEEILPD